MMIKILLWCIKGIIWILLVLSNIIGDIRKIRNLFMTKTRIISACTCTASAVNAFMISSDFLIRSIEKASRISYHSTCFIGFVFYEH